MEDGNSDDDEDDDPVVATFPKRCRCGESYDEGAWQRLKLVGVDVDYALEFRNCSCGSTLTIPHQPPSVVKG